MSSNRLKLHTVETEPLWARLRFLLLSEILARDFDTATANNHIRVLGVTFSRDLSLEKHVYLTSVRRASIGYANSDGYDVHLTLSLSRHSYMRSSRHAWTTAMLFWPERRGSP